MIFDLISFVAGALAGGVTGVLAGVLYHFEHTADLEEKFQTLKTEIDTMRSKTGAANSPPDAASEQQMRELREDLDSIRAEIRKMYRKTSD